MSYEEIMNIQSRLRYYDTITCEGEAMASKKGGRSIKIIISECAYIAYSHYYYCAQTWTCLLDQVKTQALNALF